MAGTGTALLLLLVANGAPILAARVFRHHLDGPLDGGLVLADGRPLLEIGRASCRERVYTKV